MDVFFIWEHREKSLKNVLRLYHKIIIFHTPTVAEEWSKETKVFKNQRLSTEY